MGANEDSVVLGAGDGCAVLDVSAQVFAGVLVKDVECVDWLQFCEEKVEGRA